MFLCAFQNKVSVLLWQSKSRSYKKQKLTLADLKEKHLLKGYGDKSQNPWGGLENRTQRLWSREPLLEADSRTKPPVCLPRLPEAPGSRLALLAPLALDAAFWEQTNSTCHHDQG